MTSSFPLKTPALMPFIFLATILSNRTMMSVHAQPSKGWKMTDRFTGFRYEIRGKVQNTTVQHVIQAKADELACFGWTQYTERQTVVGEVRCNKDTGNKIKMWMRELSSLSNHSKDKDAASFVVEHVEIKEYSDTKIRLHFSHFKILDEGRETCFRDEPHQCAEFK